MHGNFKELETPLSPSPLSLLTTTLILSITWNSIFNSTSSNVRSHLMNWEKPLPGSCKTWDLIPGLPLIEISLWKVFFLTLGRFSHLTNEKCWHLRIIPALTLCGYKILLKNFYESPVQMVLTERLEFNERNSSFHILMRFKNRTSFLKSPQDHVLDHGPAFLRGNARSRCSAMYWAA